MKDQSYEPITAPSSSASDRNLVLRKRDAYNCSSIASVTAFLVEDIQAEHATLDDTSGNLIMIY